MQIVTVQLRGEEDSRLDIASDAAVAPQRVEREDVEALVALRMILEEAMTRAQDTSDAGRRVTAILLDGCAEAAIGLGLASINDAPNDKDTLASAYQRLLEGLRREGAVTVDERLNGWGNVRRLRRVRNDAQHHQIPPDHGSLVNWAQSVEQFASHIIRVAFGLDLMSVVATNAIEHPRVRELFAEAESYAENEDNREAVAALERVFALALSEWRDQRTSAGVGQRHRSRDELGLGQFVEAQTSHLEDLLAVAPFAVDLGEYFWWRRLRADAQDSRVEIRATDVRRARTWVFGWVMRWEAFTARATTRERVEAEQPVAPASGRENGAPEFDVDRDVEVVATRVADGGSLIRVPVRFGDGSIDGARSWLFALERVILASGRDPEVGARAAVRGDGWIEFRVETLPASVDAVFARIEQILADAEQRHAQARDENLANQQRLARCRSEVEEVAPVIGALQLSEGSFACDRLEVRIEGDEEKLFAIFERRLHRRVLESYFLGHEARARQHPVLSHGRMHGIGVEIDLADRVFLDDAIREVIDGVAAVASSAEAECAVEIESRRAFGRSMKQAFASRNFGEARH